MNSKSKKQQIRQIVSQRRKEQTEAELAEMSRKILSRIVETEEYRQAENVFAYMHLPGEVQTLDLIRRCLKDGKRVAVPKVEGREMHFYEIPPVKPACPEESSLQHPAQDQARIPFGELGHSEPDLSCLHPGAMGIPEPDPSVCPCMDEEEKALIIMPGVAFDQSLNRIGYGGGYYDRYLKHHGAHPTMAVAFDFQVFEEVPWEETDIRPRKLITPKRQITPRSDCAHWSSPCTASDPRAR